MNDIEAKFWEFHRQNPDVFRMIRHYATQLRDAGLTHYGMGAVFERMRWHFNVERKEADFKLNNNYRSRYSRLLEQYYPEFSGFFTKRSLKTSTDFRS